jgi:chromosome partitioning protein
MKIWTIVNQKGGVGKTTSTISMAGCLSAMGYNTLLIDLDPQSSLTHYLGFDSEKNALNMFDVFVAATDKPRAPEVLRQAILETSIKNTDLIAAHMALATLDRTLGEEKGKGLIVKNALDHIANEYDFVLIDCPPVLGVLMVNALVAADTIVLPTQTEHLALQGLQKMLKTIKLMRTNLKDKMVTKIVPTLFDRRVKACLNAYSVLRKEHEGVLSRGYIPVDTKFRDASAAGKPISQIASNSRGAFSYEKLVNDLVKYA